MINYTFDSGVLEQGFIQKWDIDSRGLDETFSVFNSLSSVTWVLFEKKWLK